MKENLVRDAAEKKKKCSVVWRKRKNLPLTGIRKKIQKGKGGNRRTK